ncbi:50S ribosomal protein L15e [Nanobdella aerobiophila]|uniref:50S ribosomal protein L15e n=1 Tax=Nanobdella aerobiophila TaxID=2586965 RepID=A0A915SSK0_9ARCH|nr:50S ribosomal protein L15e [Nanobdella aerobiophila]BBL45456.1 50S ribosomal protein L15e [Nanobdella aerobiophila]
MTSIYKYIRKFWRDDNELTKRIWINRLVEFRRQPEIHRIYRPTRLDKARRLGWKPLNGIVLLRIRVKKGLRKRKDMPRHVKTVNYYYYRPLDISLRSIAEQRAQRKYSNLEVINSYYVAEDGKYKWYEIIMADPNNPNIYNREEYSWLLYRKNRKRALRGLTPSFKKARKL